jgi:hypothetical protein
LIDGGFGEVEQTFGDDEGGSFLLVLVHFCDLLLCLRVGLPVILISSSRCSARKLLILIILLYSSNPPLPHPRITSLLYLRPI